jgi:hypothetical protein
MKFNKILFFALLLFVGCKKQEKNVIIPEWPGDSTQQKKSTHSDNENIGKTK